MKRTPIAHIIFPRARLVRPIPEFAWDAVRAMTETNDLEVEVLIPVPARSVRRYAGWPEEIEAQLNELRPRPTLIPYVPIPRRSIESATVALSLHLMRRPRASRPRVLQGSFLDGGGFSAVMAARVLDAKSIVVAHGSDVQAARGNVSDRGSTRRAKKAVTSATRTLAVSSYLASELVVLGARAEVLPYTARASDFPLMPRPKAGIPTILFVGRLTREKGVDLLLEALARMKSKARLELVGPDMGTLDVNALANKLGVADRVTIGGELERPDLVSRYASATCLALPSRAEGLPCVIAEALLVGCPVVATDVGGVGELVDDRVGALVEPEDAAALADALDRVLTQRYEPAALRERVLSMTWERTGPRLAEITRALF